MRHGARWLPLLAAALLGACRSLPAPVPAPVPTPPPARPQAVPLPPPDLAAIPDAVPRLEPRSRYGNPPSYVVFGRRYHVQATAEGHVERGLASWYGPGFHAARTSSGEPYDMYAMSAAHKTLPLPAYARVTNLRNGRSVVVRINDRGPFVGDRIVDLSYTAAWKLDMLRSGTAPVELRVLSPGADFTPPMVASAGPSPPASSPLPPIAATAGSAAAIAAGTGLATPASAPPLTTLQAGAFFIAANAEALVARLAAAGIGNAAVRPTRAGARTVWQVRVGPLDGAAAVEDMRERLRRAGIPNAHRALD